MRRDGILPTSPVGLIIPRNSPAFAAVLLIDRSDRVHRKSKCNPLALAVVGHRRMREPLLVKTPAISVDQPCQIAFAFNMKSSCAFMLYSMVPVRLMTSSIFPAVLF
jgi:hypothetical protein